MKTSVAIDPARAALLLVDLQEEHRGDPRYLVAGYDAVLVNARKLLDAARAAGVPVFHAAYIVDTEALAARPFHPLAADGKSAFSDFRDPLTELCAEVAPAPGEEFLVKAKASAFSVSRLTEGLRAKTIEWLFVAGVWTEACVDASVKDAMAQGFRVALVKDACGSGSAAMHQTGILNLANRLYGGAVVDTATAIELIGGRAAQVWRVEGAVPLRYSFARAAEMYAAL